jgi:putative DNA methylase
MREDKINQYSIPGMELPDQKSKVAVKLKKSEYSSEKLGKAIRLPVSDFSDPNRPLTCLEIDFPIAKINGIAARECVAGSTRKPIYQSMKWWARRVSSVFRGMLIGASVKAPDDPNEASKQIWEHFYCNHQKAGSFNKLRVLDPFMGGGTTLVEGSRLGMQMTGVDLNPVAWFVVKNELACSDPDQVNALFEHIEAEVKPQIQPFYTTTCPRGHHGQWTDINTKQLVDIDPLEIPKEERERYMWEGPEIIYTFWAKHGPCQVKGCGHRTPIFKSPLVAEKKLSTFVIDCVCPECGEQFDAELGETRMAPGSDRIVLESEKVFTELNQTFAQLLKNYDKGKAQDTIDRMWRLHDMVQDEPGLSCPSCGAFAGKRIKETLEYHAKQDTKTSQRKKKDFNIKRKAVQMYLLIHPDWLKGEQGFTSGRELGGYAGAPAVDTVKWNKNRLKNLSLIEVRGDKLPEELVLPNGEKMDTSLGTVPKQATFTCGSCGKRQKRLDSTKEIGHTAPLGIYALQCRCPKCKKEGYQYGGRYFKSVEVFDTKRITQAEHEWEKRKDQDLRGFWPESKLEFSMRTHVKDPLPDHGYEYWHHLFNSRQLLGLSLLLKAIVSSHEQYSLDVVEQSLGAFQYFTRTHCMFSFWNRAQDCLEPFFGEANYNPKNNIIEGNVFGNIGRNNWTTCSNNVLDALEYIEKPWDWWMEDGQTKAYKNYPGDKISTQEIYQGSSTDLSFIDDKSLYDLIITDPPFGDNIYYADLSDFFYVWLKEALAKLYIGLPEAKYFEHSRSPHSMEAITNSAEHPDDRKPFEKSVHIEAKYLSKIKEMSGNDSLDENDLNPFYLPEPASDFYSQTLSTCWLESGRLLKPGGIMAFTFHHDDDQAWIDVLKALFGAGYVLVQTYPIRSDESKGDLGQFGSKKIEYDIIHVCRKRLDKIEPVSWARMRRWVKSEATRLKELLEHTHGKELPLSDLRVILRGKSLEFYSRHYGQVFTGDGECLDVRDALLGINQLLDDLLEDTSMTGGHRPPDSAEPASRLFLRIFTNQPEIPRDELHKTLRGTGLSQGDLEFRSWVRVVGKAVHVVPVHERFAYFTERGRNRKVIKTDLDQAWFLIGAAAPNSGLKIDKELNNQNFRIKKSTDEILRWYADVEEDSLVRQSAQTALKLVEHWRTRDDRPQIVQPTLFDYLEESE